MNKLLAAPFQTVCGVDIDNTLNGMCTIVSSMKGALTTTKNGALTRGAKSAGTWEPSSQKNFRLWRKFLRTKTMHHKLLHKSRVFSPKSKY